MPHCTKGVNCRLCLQHFNEYLTYEYSLMNNTSVNSKPDHPPRVYSHILVAPGVEFSLLCLAQGCAPEAVGLKVNRQRLKFVMQRPELKIPTVAKWLISPLVCVIIKIREKHLVLKTNSNINIYNET